MNYEAQTKVMLAFAAGKRISRTQRHIVGCTTILSTECPGYQFDFTTYTYEILPETKPKTQLEEIGANWPDHRVELLVRDESGDLTVQNGNFHSGAVSMNGFAGYIYTYPLKDQPYKVCLTPVRTGARIDFPVAVLFEK